MKRNLYRITIRTTPAKHKTNTSQARGAGTHIGHRASRPYHARNIHAAHALVRNEKHTSKQARAGRSGPPRGSGLVERVQRASAGIGTGCEGTTRESEGTTRERRARARWQVRAARTGAAALESLHCTPRNIQEIAPSQPLCVLRVIITQIRTSNFQ